MKSYLGFAFLFSSLLAEKALVKVPVADLVFCSYGKSQSEAAVVESYKRLACGDECCERAYQLLFNEIVEVEERLGIEVKVKVPHIVYFDTERQTYDNSYWTLASNLVPLSQLQEKGLDLAKIPKTVCWHRLDLSYCLKDTISLTMPFEDPETGLIYSAGTRFIVDAEEGGDAQVWVFCSKILTLRRTKVPLNICKKFEKKPLDERISDYINLLRKWTKLNEGFIPYVYSGSSFTVVTNVDQFKDREDDKGCAFYWRDEYGKVPYAGFDCSCIISRAAQICGIAYFYKDSHTLVRNLDPLQMGESVEEGDIIWFPGHVMIVSDVKNNLLIESRGYASGFGKTHEIELSKAFAEVSTYQELVKAHLNKHALKLLARDGSLRYVLEDFKILKFKSYVKFGLRG